jgi:hypothetical protein
MGKRSFEVAIADLEKADILPSTSLDNAARLVKFDTEQAIEQCKKQILYGQAAPSLGLKEQWLLRWLLRKLNNSATDSKDNTVDE